MIEVIIISALIAIIHFSCLSNASNPKYSSKKMFLIYSLAAVFFVLSGALCEYFIPNKTLSLVMRFLVAIISVAIIFMVTSKDMFSKKAFLFVTYANSFCIFVIASVLIIRNIFIGANETLLIFLITILTLIFSTILGLLYKFKFQKIIRSLGNIHSKEWYSISVVSTLFLIVFSILTIFAKIHFNEINFIMAFLSELAVYGAVIWVIFGTISSMRTSNTMSLISQNLDYLENELDVAKKHELEFKTLRHDIRHHQGNLIALLKENKVQDALNYIDVYDENMKVENINYCPNNTVNSILVYFNSKAQLYNISFEATADVIEEVCIKNLDFVAILSNLLENAIHGVLEVKKPRKISINVRSVDEKIIILCSNTSRTDLAINNHMLVNKSIGIESMINSINKYSGNISYELNGNELSCCIILNC